MANTYRTADEADQDRTQPIELREALNAWTTRPAPR
jgi:hypothetical protein